MLNFMSCLFGCLQYDVFNIFIYRFTYVPCPYTKEILTQVLTDALNMFNITKKISSVAIDHCSNNAMIDILQEILDSLSHLSHGDFLHLRLVHIYRIWLYKMV